MPKSFVVSFCKRRDKRKVIIITSNFIASWCSWCSLIGVVLGLRKDFDLIKLAHNLPTKAPQAQRNPFAGAQAAPMPAAQAAPAATSNPFRSWSWSEVKGFVLDLAGGGAFWLIFTHTVLNDLYEDVSKDDALLFFLFEQHHAFEFSIGELSLLWVLPFQAPIPSPKQLLERGSTWYRSAAQLDLQGFSVVDGSALMWRWCRWSMAQREKQSAKKKTKKHYKRIVACGCFCMPKACPVPFQGYLPRSFSFFLFLAGTHVVRSRPFRLRSRDYRRTSKRQRCQSVDISRFFAASSKCRFRSVPFVSVLSFWQERKSELLAILGIEDRVQVSSKEETILEHTRTQKFEEPWMLRFLERTESYDETRSNHKATRWPQVTSGA